MAEETKQSTWALVRRLPKLITRIVTLETENAKQEVGARIKNLLIGLVLLTIALIFLFWTTAVLLTAAIAGLGTAMPLWLAALIIAGAGLVVIAVCVIAGIILCKQGGVTPKSTIARIKADFIAAGRVTKSVKKLAPQPGKKGTAVGETGVWE